MKATSIKLQKHVLSRLWRPRPIYRICFHSRSCRSHFLGSRRISTSSSRSSFLPLCSQGSSGVGALGFCPPSSGVGALGFCPPPSSEEMSDSGPLSLWQSNMGLTPGLVNLFEEWRPISFDGEGFVQSWWQHFPGVWGCCALSIHQVPSLVA